MGKPVSLKEIARIARVSHPTVSRALRNSPLIRPETAERIRRIAAELGYQPNKNARSLVTRRSSSIGCVVTDIADPFIGEVIKGVEEVAARNDYSIILTNSGGNPEREMRAVRSLFERAVDGVLVVGSRVGGAYFPYLTERQIPIVVINNQHPGDFVHSVGIANYEAAKTITSHLGGLGHKNIAYIGDRYGGQSNKDRHAGYCDALRQMRIRYTRKFVVHSESTISSGQSGMNDLLALTTQPTAVFCYDDITALGAYRAIRKAGLRIPHDISIVGFDDLFFSAYLEPMLTTVRQPMYEMGQRGMKLLLDLLSASVAVPSRTKTRIVIAGKFVVRESTAPPAS